MELCSVCFRPVEPAYMTSLPFKCEDCQVDQWIQLGIDGRPSMFAHLQAEKLEQPTVEIKKHDRSAFTEDGLLMRS